MLKERCAYESCRKHFDLHHCDSLLNHFDDHAGRETAANRTPRRLEVPLKKAKVHPA